jgi:transposase-like protein
MEADLQNPIFIDNDAAREALEAVRWPNGPICPHCGAVERIVLIGGEKHSHRPGLYYCNNCKGQFTVTVGSVFERSKVPLTKWWLATFLLCSSKKGISSHQLHRSLGVTYKTAWFMSMRIREAMREGGFAPIGGQNKVVEADETFIGGKARNRKNHVPPKTPVLSLVERDGSVRSFHVPNVTAQTLKPIIVANVNKASYLIPTKARSTGRSARNSAGMAPSIIALRSTSALTSGIRTPQKAFSAF